jgi:hypothetical protein
MRLTLALLAIALLAACGGNDDEDDTTAVADSSGTGTIAVSLEETNGAFIEGFEIALRFEAADGAVIESLHWTDFVQSTGAEDIDAYYDAVLEQPVPAGRVVVLATTTIGPGGPPEKPDLDGPLDCRLEVDVPGDGRVEVEVSFAGTGDCLALL